MRITCPSDVAEVVVAPLLGELIERYPALRIELAPERNHCSISRAARPTSRYAPCGRSAEISS